MASAPGVAKVQTEVPGGKYDALVRPDGMVHRSVYVDPGIFEEEMTRIFARSWVFLLHEAEIPQLNDFKQITVGRRSTLVRGWWRTAFLCRRTPIRSPGTGLRTRRFGRQTPSRPAASYPI